MHQSEYAYFIHLVYMIDCKENRPYGISNLSLSNEILQFAPANCANKIIEVYKCWKMCAIVVIFLYCGIKFYK